MPKFSAFQAFSMPSKMRAHEGRDEIIAVVISWLHADGRWLTNGGALLYKQTRFKLCLQEIVVAALVNQKVRQARTVCYQGNAVISAPLRAVLSDIATQRLFTPGTAQRRHDRRERGC